MPIMDRMNSDQVTAALVTALDKADPDSVLLMLMTKLAKTYLDEHAFRRAAEIASQAALLRANIDTVPYVLAGESYVKLFEQRLADAAKASYGPTRG